MAAPAPLRVLVVGCGNMAGGFDQGSGPGAAPLTHAGAYSEHPGFRIEACVDPLPAAREAFMRRWSVPRGYAQLSDVLQAGEGFDVISLCSPTGAHTLHLEQCLQLRPRLLFCEKPLTAALADTEHWTGRYASAGIPVAVNHTRRWAPDVQRLQAELAAGTWGKLRSATGHYNKGVLNNGSHMIDLLQYFAGPLELLAAGRPVSDFSEDDPSIPALLQAGGVPVQLSVGDARDFSLFELTLVTSQAVLTMEDGGMRWNVRRAIDSPHFAGYRALSEPSAVAGEYRAAMRAAVANVYAALHEGAALASTAATALAAQRLCHQIKQAAAKETP